MDMVKKTLGQNDDEKTPKQKRTQLENIDEEAISVDFVKKQFSNFNTSSTVCREPMSVKQHPNDMHRAEDGSSSKHSQSFFPDRNFVQMNSGNDEQDIMPPTAGSMSSNHHGSIEDRGSSHLGSNEFVIPVDLSLTVTQIAKQFGL